MMDVDVIEENAPIYAVVDEGSKDTPEAAARWYFETLLEGGLSDYAFRGEPFRISLRQSNELRTMSYGIRSESGGFFHVKVFRSQRSVNLRGSYKRAKFGRMAVGYESFAKHKTTEEAVEKAQADKKHALALQDLLLRYLTVQCGFYVSVPVWIKYNVSLNLLDKDFKNEDVFRAWNSGKWSIGMQGPAQILSLVECCICVVAMNSRIFPSKHVRRSLPHFLSKAVLKERKSA